MAFRIPTKRDILNRIVIRLAGRERKVTDLTLLANFRMIVEALADEYLLLHAALQRALDSWRIQRAKGEDLERRLADFGVTRPPAIAATGQVLFLAGASVPVTISPGVVLRTEPVDDTPQKRYRVLANPDRTDGLWIIADSNGGIRVNVAAVAAGTIGNTSSETIVALDSPITGVESVTNEGPITDGRDAATDDEFREYFKTYLQSLTRGTRGALLFFLLNYVDPVTGVRPVRSAALREWNGQTLLDVSGNPVALIAYVDLVAGASPTSIQARVDGTGSESDIGWRAAGVPTALIAATKVRYDIVARIDVDGAFNSETVRRNVVDRIFSHVARLPVGGFKLAGGVQGQLSFARLVSDVQDVAGVLRVVFERPTADLAVDVGTKLEANVITVTVNSVT